MFVIPVCIKSVGGQRQFVSVSKIPASIAEGDAPYGKVTENRDFPEPPENGLHFR